MRRREEYRAFLLAGETALSERSMLNGPWVYNCDFYNLEDVEDVASNWTTLDYKDYIGLELWRCDPKLLADDKTVDVISFVISLQNIVDERVEQCIKDMVEDFPW